MSPKHQERRFAKGYAATLLRIAEEDFRTARFAQRGVAAGEVRPENVFFLYQQSIEKLLKAVLCHLERPVPMVHDLGVLLAKLPEEKQPAIGYEIAGLNDFAGIRRYEAGSILYEPEDIDDARTLTEELLAWARSIVAR
ncbi:MAG: HEPN domain-containing protein [Spirochaetales bacterium]|nr:HEPN domain-containing protein [Spirochaetales bacterium]